MPRKIVKMPKGMSSNCMFSAINTPNKQTSVNIDYQFQFVVWLLLKLQHAVRGHQTEFDCYRCTHWFNWSNAIGTNLRNILTFSVSNTGNSIKSEKKHTLSWLKVKLLASHHMTILQFFSLVLAQFSNEESIFQNIELKSLNNSFVVHNRLEFLIRSSKLHCFGKCVQKIQYSARQNLLKNHLHMAHWSRLISLFSAKLSNSSQLINILSLFEHHMQNDPFNYQNLSDIHVL